MRAIARSAPRTLSRNLTTAAIRRSSPIASSALRASSAATFRPLQAFTSSFSTSVYRNAPAQNEVDEQLSAKLQSELDFESNAMESEPQPASVKDFLDSGLFEVVDIPGKEEVTLRRKYGDETITVTFSIADLNNYDGEEFSEDPALADEGVEEGREQEDAAAEAEGEEAGEGEEYNEAAVPCRLSIVVEKPSKGALNIGATVQDGSILVENVFFYPDANLANPTNAEAAHKSAKVYPGPPFGTLDEDLQILIERYLEERGVTQALAVFVPDYMDIKEQREYISWLNNVKGFVDA